MTIKSVWGRMQGRTATLIQHEGGKWVFQVPPWAVSPLIVEFWAEDLAGNIAYRTGIFTLDAGKIKCIRWLNEGSSLTMLPDERPGAEMLAEDRPGIALQGDLSISMLDADRPCIEMLAHTCSRLIEVSL